MKGGLGRGKGEKEEEQEGRRGSERWVIGAARERRKDVVDFKWRGTRKRKRRGVRGSDEEEEGRDGKTRSVIDRKQKNRRKVSRRKRTFKR